MAPSVNLSSVWGKLTHDTEGRVVGEQTLSAHCRDVAAVFAALIVLPGIISRLGRLMGSPLNAAALARLTYLVHLHDMGKVNAGFQARRDRAAPVVGHVTPLACLIGDRADKALADGALLALDAARMESWGAGVEPLLDAILSHHGKPWRRDDARHADRRHWRRTSDGYDPLQALAALRADADAFVPLAHESGWIAALPDAPRFVHAVAGLAQLADWIASSGWEQAPDEPGRASWAAARLRMIGLDPEPWRAPLRDGGLPSFEALFGNVPYPHQVSVGELPGRLLIIESETGSGKTEAALWRFASLFSSGAVDGLYFALPTRTAAVQLHARVEAFASRLWPDGAPPVVLAVPGYLDERGSRQPASGALPVATDPLDATEEDARGTPVWASEHPKRYFAGLMAVGTVDQALLAILRVKHAHLRGSALMRQLLVLDEVHASDAYMRRLLGRLLRDHLAAGGYAVLLSATLGAEARHQLVVEARGGRVVDEPAPGHEVAEGIRYPLLTSAAPVGVPVAVSGCAAEKVVQMQSRDWLDDPVAIAGFAIEAAREGGRVLVIRNTVDGAVAVQRAIESLVNRDEDVLFRIGGVPALHHGRYAREDRRTLDHAVEQAIGRTRPGGGCVIVGTQTLEQSLDLDADLLVTDLCPVDVLLQRLGRLHRHRTDGRGRERVRPPNFRAPQAVVLVPTGGLIPFLGPRRPNGLRRHGLGHRLENGVPRGVYADLTVLEATRRLVVTRPAWSIPTMNRELVEAAIHSEAITALLAGLPEEERERWVAHRRSVEGARLADSQLATDGALFRDRPFMDEPNTRFDERLATRLGADDRLVELPDATVGPFHQFVRRLVLPGWMVPGAPAEVEAVVVAQRDDVGYARLRVILGERELVYDRHGLRAAEDE